MTPEEVAVSALSSLNSSPSQASKEQVFESDKKPSAVNGSLNNNPSEATSKKSRRKKVVHKFPVEPVLINSVQRQKGVMDHTYRDFSIVPPEIGYDEPTTIEEMTFAQKVHHILSQKENEKIIRWMPHGRAFKVVVPVAFERSICPLYFGHKRYSSFLRQLNNHSFKHLTKGEDRNCYYHECMLKNMPHLCKYMPEPKDARRLVPDPRNEPNFYQISASRPVPDTAGKVGKPTAAVAAAAAPVLPTTSPPCASAVEADQSLLQARLASQVSWMANPTAKRAALGNSVGRGSSLAQQHPQLSTLLGQSSALSQQQQVLGLGSSLQGSALIEALRRRRAEQEQSLLASLGRADTSAALARYLQPRNGLR